MIYLHYTIESRDHRHAVTYCGMEFITDKARSDKAKASGRWCICPLCELRYTLIRQGLEPDPMQHGHPAGRWVQPTLFEA